jgi:multisubunit Na+/H+ antiporter MnhB subunit
LFYRRPAGVNCSGKFAEIARVIRQMELIVTQKSKMNSYTKYRLVKLLIYVIVGFAVAFFWHVMKNKQ